MKYFAIPFAFEYCKANYFLEKYFAVAGVKSNWIGLGCNIALNSIIN